MEQKHSDDLFRDKLTDFSQHPDPKVWDRIERSLDQRKSRRVLPIWWRLGGVAAILALALYLIVPGNDLNLPDTPAVSDQPVETPPATPPAGIPAKNDLPATDDLPIEPSAVAKQNTVKDRNNKENESQAFPGSKQVPTPSAATAVAGVENSEAEKTRNRPAVADVDKNAAANETNRTRDEKEAVASTGNKIPDPAQPRDALTVVAQGDPKGSDKGILSMESEEVASDTQDSKDERQSIYKAIEEREAIEEQEALAQSESGDRRWTVGPSLAPVYFDSFGDGSPIAQNFVPNSKSGTMNMSYGMTVSYAVTEKLSLRSGVHRVDFGYNTDQVTFTSSLNAGPSSLIQTISYSENSKNLVVHSTASNAAAALDENAATDVTAPTAERQGSMEQEFGYLEVPFELQYALIDRKFGLNLIGGMSSMFLVDNRVSLNSLGERTEMGEARNINSLNFSGNFGLGFTYNLNAALQLNMQPMFKYQLNTFSETAGNFRPFSVGVYSGLSFRF